MPPQGDAYNAYPSGHYSMHEKSVFNWIETNEVINVTASGVYRVRRFDHIDARLLAGTKLALKVKNSVGDEFWIGHRRTMTNYPALLTGAYVVWVNSPTVHRLLDTTPLSQPNMVVLADKADSPLQPGRAFVDPSGTVRITTLGAGGVSPNEYLDIEVLLLTNNPPFQIFTTTNRTTRGILNSAMWLRQW